IGFLGHESWRVRAEAIDSLADMAIASRQEVFPKEEVADAAMKLLDDSDGFVASRALAAMKPLAQDLSTAAMDNAIKRHPELALDVIKMLGNTGRNNPQAVCKLRAFCASASPATRAAAIAALAEISPAACDAEIKAALHDKDSNVRIAGSNALFSVLVKELPQDGMVEKPSFFGFGGGKVKVNPEQWLAKFHTPAGHREWFDACRPDLRAMLKSDSERLTAAYPLVMRGFDTEALPVVLAAAKNDAASRDTAAWLLPWLPWEKRLAWFKTLSAMQSNDSIVANLASQMAAMRDVRAAEPIWAM